MRNMLVRGKETDVGHILENLIYLELAQTTLDEQVLQRELAPLKKINDNFV